VQLKVPDYVIVIVEDIDRAVRFYTEILGLRLGHRADEYAQFDTGVTRLALYSRRSMAKTLGRAVNPSPPDAVEFELGFKVDDVDSAYLTLVGRGATAITPPTDRPWGQRTAYISDPDGHLIELAQQTRTPPT
jgi:lactoylglutathione lyase